MELTEFKDELIEQIRFSSSVEGTSDREEFVNYVSNALIEAEDRGEEKSTLRRLENARKHCSSREETMEFIGVPEDQRPKYAELMKEKELQGA